MLACVEHVAGLGYLVEEDETTTDLGKYFVQYALRHVFVVEASTIALKRARHYVFATIADVHDVHIRRMRNQALQRPVLVGSEDNSHEFVASPYLCSLLQDIEKVLASFIWFEEVDVVDA